MISVIKTYDSDVAVKLGGCDSCGCHEDLVTVSFYRDAGEAWKTTGIVLCRKCMETAIRTMHAAASDDKFWEDE